MLVFPSFRKLFSMIALTKSQCKLAAVNFSEKFEAKVISSILEDVTWFSKPKSSFREGEGVMLSYPQAAISFVLVFAIIGSDSVTAPAALQASRMIKQSEFMFSSLFWIFDHFMDIREFLAFRGMWELLFAHCQCISKYTRSRNPPLRSDLIASPLT